MRDPMASLSKRVNEEDVPKPRVRLTRGPKPGPVEIDLSGPSGNVYVVMGTTIALLRRAGKTETADEFKARAKDCHSYDEVLALVAEYLEVV